MATTIDHLRQDHWVRVLRDFTDLQGVLFRAGTRGLLRTQDVDWKRQTIRLRWEIAGNREEILLPLISAEGPANGRMKEYFELGAYDPLPRSREPPHPSQLAPVTAIDRYDLRSSDPLQRVLALATQHHFVEAEAQLYAITGLDLLDLAEALSWAAEAHANDADRRLYEWLRERATNQWYAWGATATSGGEGAAMSLKIKAAMQRFGEWDKRGEKQTR